MQPLYKSEQPFIDCQTPAASSYGQALCQFIHQRLIVSGICLVGTKKVHWFSKVIVVNACYFQDSLTYRNQLTSRLSFASFPRYLGWIGRDSISSPIPHPESLGNEVKFIAILQLQVLLICSFNKYLLRIPYVQALFLGTGNTVMNQTDEFPV